ncbi:GGDEF domain-containing protein [bacterium]|nr:GGDEF domain-containing protein [bacterium]
MCFKTISIILILFLSHLSIIIFFIKLLKKEIDLRKNTENKLYNEIDEKIDIIKKIVASEKYLKELMTIIEYSPISIVITDSENVIRYGNSTMLQLTGYSKEEIIGKTPNIFKSDYHSKEFYEKMWSDLKLGKEWRGEFKNLKKDGSFYWERAIIIPVKDELGRVYRFLALKEDISEQKRYMEQLYFQAERDSLTGIYNRRAGLNFLQEEIECSKKYGMKLSICFLDINNLKTVNDSLGHDFGDEMIKRFVDTVSFSLREEDIFFRFGGDEFIVIFKYCNFDSAEKIWQRVKLEINSTNKTIEKYQISVSHGVVEYDSELFQNIDDFITEADKRMYAEKKIIKGLK